MKSKIMFFQLLILGSFLGSECGQISCIQQAKQATCNDKCSTSDLKKREYCQRQCTQHLTAGTQLKQVRNVSLDCHFPSGQTTDIRITFDTFQDKCYTYLVTCRQINGTYIRNQTVNTTASRGSEIFRHLPLGAKFVVGVRSIVGKIVGNETTTDFRTPLPKRTSSYPKICVLPKVKNLKAKAIPTKGNRFNVTVYWDKPSLDTESLTLTLKTDRNHTRNQFVPATTSRFVFKDVQISRNYTVSVKASSWAGTGETGSRDFRLPETKPGKKTEKEPNVQAGRIDINLKGSTAKIILGVLIGFGCAMAVAWFIYRHRKNRAEREKDSEGGSVADADDSEGETAEKEDELETASLKNT